MRWVSASFHLVILFALLRGCLGSLLLLETNGSDQGTCTTSPCATLLYAITVASNGDTLQLGMGTFSGPQNRNLDPGSLGKRDLTIQGQGPTTILDLQASGRAFTFTAAAGAATLQRLAIVNGSCTSFAVGARRGAAVNLVTANVTLSDLKIQNMFCQSEIYNPAAAGDFSGAAICSRMGTNRLIRLTVQDSAASYGGAVAFWGTDASSVVDSVFERSSANFWGGAGLVERLTRVTFTRCRFSYGVAKLGGGLFSDGLGSAQPVFDSCILEFGTALPPNSVGGAVNSQWAAQWTFKNTSFLNNFARDGGGAVYLGTGTSATFTGGSFVNNTASAGGAVASQATGARGVLQFINVNFTSNVAGYGGAISADNSLLVSNCTFVSNSALAGGAYSGWGGALGLTSTYGLGNGTVIISSSFLNNTATASGGALLTFPSGNSSRSPELRLSLANVTFQNNTVLAPGGTGGAVFLSGLHTASMTGSLFIRNSAPQGGALAFAPTWPNRSLLLNNSRFLNNMAGTQGGAVYCGGSASLVLSGTSVLNSISQGDGGGAFLDCASLQFVGSSFSNNSALGGKGGGILFGPNAVCSNASGSRFQDLQLVNNSAVLSGGALYFQGVPGTMPSCVVPAVGQPATWNQAVPSAWTWSSFGQLVFGNTAPSGPFEATFPNSIVATDAHQLPVASFPGYVGVSLGLWASVQDILGQSLLDNTLSLTASLPSPVVGGIFFNLQGFPTVHFSNGVASLNDIKLLATGFPTTDVTVPLQLQPARGVASLKAVPVLLVNISVGQCPSGYVQSNASNGLVQCTICHSGHYAPTQLDCPSCPVGSFSSTAGSSTCSPCPAGNGCPLGTSLPAPCSPGTVQPQARQESCVACAQGFYQSASGQTECTVCPPGMQTLLAKSGSASDCVCKAGSYLRSVGNSSRCQPCSEGMICPAGSTAPAQSSGFFVQTTADGFEAFRCLPDYCAEGALGACAPGRNGFVCSVCQDGSFPSSDGSCMPCRSADAVPIIVLIVAVLLFLAVLTLLARADISRQSHALLTAVSIVGQAVVTLQTLATLGQLNLNWPAAVEAILNVISLVRFNVAPLRYQCVTGTDSPLMSFGVQLLAFPATVVVLVAIMGCFRLARHKVYTDDVLNSIGVLITICFLPASVTALNPFRCERNPNGSSSIKTQPQILCGSALHSSLVAVGVIATICYMVTVLAGALFVTLRYPKTFARGGGPRLVRRFGFLFTRFTPVCYYYGLLFLLRSTLIALMPLWAPQASSQVLGLAFVIELFYSLQCGLQPWRTKLANVTEELLSFWLLMVLVAAAAVQSSSPDLAGVGSFVTVCLLLLLCSPALILLVVAGSWLRRMARGKRFPLFLSHHKAGAASLARFFKQAANAKGLDAFLDSDELQNLELLLDFVRTDTGTLVLLLSSETLRRPWCAGEIVVAHKMKVPILPVLAPNFRMPTDEELQDLSTWWPMADLNQLEVVGVTAQDVREAYENLRTIQGIQLPAVFETAQCAAKLRAAADQVLQQCGGARSSATSHFSKSLGSASVTILVNYVDIEAIAAALVLTDMLQLFGHFDTRLSFTPEEFQQAAESNAVLVLMTPGCLESKDFMRSLFQQRSAISSKFLCVRGNSAFEYPPSSHVAERLVPMMSAECKVDAGAVSECYGLILSQIAMQFSAHANQGVIKTEILMLCSRLEEIMCRQGLQKCSRTFRGNSTQPIADKVAPTAGNMNDQMNLNDSTEEKSSL